MNRNYTVPQEPYRKEYYSNNNLAEALGLISEGRSYFYSQ